MTDEDIKKITAKLIVSLATKEDIQEVKEDIQGIKVDLQGVKYDIQDLKSDVKKLEVKIDKVDRKASTILEYAEAVDEDVDKHEKRLRSIERIPIVANELKKPRF